MPNKQFFLSFEKFEKGLIVLYVRDLPVGVGGEPHQALVVEKDPEGRQRGHQDVDSEVVFGLVDQVGFGQVLLNNEGSALGDLAPLVDHLDLGKRKKKSLKQSRQNGCV